MTLTQLWILAIFLCLALVLSSCAVVPQSVRMYAADISGRAHGQYTLMPDEIREQLVRQDSLLQCALDRNDGLDGVTPACQCAMGAGEWEADCGLWAVAP